MRTRRWLGHRTNRNIAAALVAFGVLGVEGAALATPTEREQCAASAERAQQLRDEGKYRQARTDMLFCARPTCPGPIKTDCGRWLNELERDAPTVVFGARGAGGDDVLDTRVSMDGELVQERLDGKPVLVDAGEHTFRFESTEGVKEERVLVRTGEKARPLVVSFAPTPAAQGASAPAPAPAAAREAPSPRRSIVPAAALAGVSVLALGSFAAFGLSGRSDYDDLQKCKPTCATADVDSTRTKLLVADISLGVGVVALGAAAYLFFTRSSGSAAPTGEPHASGGSARVDLSPVRGGGLAGLSGTF